MANLVHKSIATGLGTGFIPFAPGTFGTLAGVIVLLVLNWLLPGYFSGGFKQAHYLFFLVLAVSILGAWSIKALIIEWGKDPQRVVIDEIAGVWISMIGIPVNLVNLGIAFVLFRVFDIWKPLGIRKMESIPGGWGVLLDDLLAGVYVCAIMHLLQLIL